MGTLILAALLLYAAAAALLYWLQGRIVYPAPRGGFAEPADAGLEGGRRLDVRTADGVQLHGWFLEARTIARSPVPTIVLFHGNGENVTLDAGWHELLRSIGAHVAAVDYRGYGLSGGSPSEAGLYEDGRAVVRHLIESGLAEPSRLVLLGSSLGTAVAVVVASEFPVAGVILQAPFDSMRALARRKFPIFPSFLLRDPYDTLARASRVSCPVLVLHGDRDEIVPIDAGERLYKCFPSPAGFHRVPGAGHNDLIAVAGDGYRQWIGNFLGRVVR